MDKESSNVFLPTRFEIPSSRIIEERLEQVGSVDGKPPTILLVTCLGKTFARGATSAGNAGLDPQGGRLSESTRATT